FPSNFTVEKNKRTGAAPFWILECPFPTGAIYLSDYQVTFTTWKGGATTKGWVKNWGQITEDISGEMALTKVSSFSLDVIIDPYIVPNIETILDTPANNPETTDCKLYLAFLDWMDLPDPPQLIWRGNITDWERTDDLIMRLEMTDISVRLDKYIGVTLDATSYPKAHPDDIGQVKPIVYGPNNMIACLRSVWGERTTLKVNITATETTCYVSDGSKFPAAGSVWIDDERIAYTSITTTVGVTETTYRLNGMTRGSGSTTATPHGAGAQVCEYLANYDSIVAAHGLKAIKGIYASIGGDLLQVSSGVSTLLSGGDTVLRATGNITVKAAMDTIGINDPGHYHGNVLIANVYGTGSSVNNAEAWTWTNAATPLNLRDGSLDTFVEARINSSSSQATATFSVTFPAYNGPTPSAVYAVVTHTSFIGTPSPAGAYVRVSGVNLNVSNVKVTQRISLGTTVPTSITVTAEHYGSASTYSMSCRVYEIELEINTARTSTSLAAVTKTGGIVATRAVDKFVVFADGYGDDNSGTFTGTAGALISRPADVVKHFLNAQTGWPVADFTSNLSAVFSGYSFSVVIDSYVRLKQWLGKMAWECRCYFRFGAARAELIVRPDTLTSVKMITADMTAMDSGSHKTLTKIKRSPLEDVINKIEVKYNRNASKGGDDSYRGTYKTSDATSIQRYGEKEKPGLFVFDFVQDGAMAMSVANFYLARYKDRRRIVELDVFLDNVELEFADGITLTELGNLLCEIQQANIEPGSGRDMRNDRIHLKAREY
ncbi:MAG: hypothetical protein LBQ00_00100, partial [Syntrophobacterales bacterium]|nr:hypothetical protein [Syntrophobacterales bacterium]